MAEDVLLFDTEANGLLDAVTKMWLIQIGTPDGNEVDLYADQPGYRPLAEGAARLKAARKVVAHNALGYDYDLVNRFFPGTLTLEQIEDTLVMCRLADPACKDHTLDAHGKRLGILKGKYKGDFQKFDSELVEYATQDIHVLRALYREVSKKLDGWGESVPLEHRVARVIILQERNGFRLNREKAVELEAELRQEIGDIETELQDIFPPIYVQVREKGEPKVMTPKRDDKRMGYTAGCPLTKVELQAFNPGSHQQVAMRLQRKYRWKPKVFTASGAPQLDEEILSALPYPEAKAMLRYFKVQKRLGQLSDGKSGWLKVMREDTGRVHGRVNPNGAVTGRMSHFSPNLANVDKQELRMREVWEPRPGWKLVGVDGSGLEARMLAHYLAHYDKGAFAHKVVSGKKEDGTDIHTANLNVLKPLGLINRDKNGSGAKTVLYALMYGSGDPNLGAIVKEDRRNSGAPPLKINNRELGKQVRAALAKSMVGLDKLTDQVKFRVKHQGYVKGLDGRHIFIRSEHSAFNFLLQGAGAVVMKKALELFHYEIAPHQGWEHGTDFAYCANVHDEVQIECRPEIAEELGEAFKKCITLAGVRLKVRCPLAGDAAVGANWRETH